MIRFPGKLRILIEEVDEKIRCTNNYMFIYINVVFSFFHSR